MHLISFPVTYLRGGLAEILAEPLFFVDHRSTRSLHVHSLKKAKHLVSMNWNGIKIKS